MKTVFLSATAAIAIAASAVPALAQDPAQASVAAPNPKPALGPDPAVMEGEAIVVTARRREETLQSIPAAVTAITQATLTRSSATDLADVARMTPGLSYNSGNAGGLSQPTLRGVTNVTTTTFDNNVGVFLDGVYLSAKSNLDIDLFNLSRVEVIKGPQSALYGNNAFAGAINYVLAEPTNAFSGRVRASVGTDGWRDVAGKLSIPITPDLRALVTGTYSHFGGTIDNSQSSAKLGGWDHKVSGSAMLKWTPGSAFTASLFYYHYEDRLDGSANYIFTNNCGGENSTNTTANRGGSNLRFRCGQLDAPDTVNVDPASYSTRKTNLGIGRMAYDFGPVTLRYTGSYAKYDTYALQDQSLNTFGGTLPTGSRKFIQPYVGPAREWSSEVRLESYGNSLFDWSAGGYYYDRRASQITVTGTGLTQTARSQDQVSLENSTMKSAFALGTLKITPKFDIEAQGRWTWEDKDAVLTNSLTSLVRTPSADFSYGTYRVTGNWRWAENKSVYAVVASGTKSGGFNNTAVLTEQYYGPEKNTSFEIGSKNQFLDGRVIINVAAYYIDWNDLQLSVPSAIAGQTNPVTNAGSASVKGFDVGIDMRPARHWSINVGYSYADPTWDKGTIDYSSSRACATAAACSLTAVGTGVDISGRQIARTSEHQLVVANTVTIPLPSSEVYVRGDLSYRSAQISSSAIALQNTGDQTLVNGRIGWVKGNVELSVFAKNLFNKQYIASTINEPEFAPSTTFTTGFVTNGRILGMGLDVRF